MIDVPRIDDSDYVASEYADDARLTGRAALWRARTDPQPQDVALRRVRDLAPATVLEVGGGEGEFAAALADVGIDVTAIGQSERMVALTAARGVRAQQADVQQLPFDDGPFDLAVANYMLYHVPDIPCALGEIARVLRPRGTLVAVTNSVRKLREMWDLVGRDRDGASEEGFNSENGDELLAAHFDTVERVDVEARFTVTESRSATTSVPPCSPRSPTASQTFRTASASPPPAACSSPPGEVVRRGPGRNCPADGGRRTHRAHRR